jgi:dUTP pyrophosphatase
MSFHKSPPLNLTLKISAEPHGVLPYRSRPEDVGFDLTARQVTPETQRATDILTFMVDFGVRIEPPAGYYAELIPRSSLTWTGFIMPNSVGVIDPDYRGILMMPLVYLGSPDQASIKSQELVGRRLAQLVLRPNYEVSVQRVDISELSATGRGESGFGSSGH